MGIRKRDEKKRARERKRKRKRKGGAERHSYWLPEDQYSLVLRGWKIGFKKFSGVSRLNHLRSKKIAKREIPPPTITQANSDERV